MFLRADDVIDMAQSFYPVMSGLGRTPQLLTLALFRQDISRLLADMQKFVNLSKNVIAYVFSSCFCDCIPTENTSSTVYSNMEAQISIFCKIYERLVFVSAGIYLAAPAVLEFWSSQTASRSIVHLDVGFFNDL